MTWPLPRESSLDVTQRPVFTAAECDRIIAMADDQAGWSSAGVYVPTAGGTVDYSSRSVQGTPLPVDVDRFPLRQLVDALAEANDETYGYDLRVIPQRDFPNVLRYSAESADHFRAHRDTGRAFSTRKLTFTLQLSDPRTYMGCDLIFTDLGMPADRAQGMLVTFPSFEMHHVTPVVRGTRYAIVGWVHGDSYV